MNILFIAPSAYSLGGVQTWLDYLLPGLQTLGERATIALVDGDHHRAAQYLQQHPAHSHLLISNPTGSAEGRVRALMRCIESNKPDLVVSVNIGDTCEAMLRLRRAKRSPARLVMTIHGIEPDYFGDLIRYQNLIDGVVVTNRLTAALVEELVTVDSQRLHYAPYGVQPGKARRTSEQEKLFRVLWMGRLEQPQKRVFELVDIVRGLSTAGLSAELTIAGDGPERDAVRRDMEAMDTGTVAVKLPGHVAHKDLLENHLPESDALLVNSTWETGPITIWEAMMAGVPVVSSRYVGSGLEGSLVAEQNCLMFDVGDTRAACDALARLQGDPELASRLAGNARALVESRYSVLASVASWHTAFQQVMGQPINPGPLPPIEAGSANGTLDRMLGPRSAESVRRLIGRRFRHLSPGGEWPHARTSLTSMSAEAFRGLAERLDRQNRSGSPE